VSVCHRSLGVLSRRLWGVGDCGKRGVSSSNSGDGREGGVGPWFWVLLDGVSIWLRCIAAAVTLMDLRAGSL
jgi:hypothetical protein